MPALDRLGLTTLFTEVVLDSLAGYSKPDPDLLRYVCSLFGRKPEEILVVGNRVDHDVIPALGLGCPVAFVLPNDGWEVPGWVCSEVAGAYKTAAPERPACPPDSPPRSSTSPRTSRSWP